MTNEKQPPRHTANLGPGTGTKGRLTKGEPLEDDFVVGNHGPPYDITRTDALSPLLEHVEFPATVDEVNARIGNVRVPIDRERTKTVREIMDDVAPEEFASPNDVHHAVNRLWDKIADREGRGGRHPQGDNLGGRPGND